jgi:hypothetical protein
LIHLFVYLLFSARSGSMREASWGQHDACHYYLLFIYLLLIYYLVSAAAACMRHPTAA